MTIYVASLIARCNDGEIITTNVVKWESAEAAIERAERMSRNDGYLGAFAFIAIGD
jgi:hypothetical protein